MTQVANPKVSGLFSRLSFSENVPLEKLLRASFSGYSYPQNDAGVSRILDVFPGSWRDNVSPTISELRTVQSMAQRKKPKDLLTIRADRDNYYFGTVLRPSGKTTSKGYWQPFRPWGICKLYTYSTHTHVYLHIVICVFVYIHRTTCAVYINKGELTGWVVYLIVCLKWEYMHLPAFLLARYPRLHIHIYIIYIIIYRSITLDMNYTISVSSLCRWCHDWSKTFLNGWRKTSRYESEPLVVQIMPGLTMTLHYMSNSLAEGILWILLTGSELVSEPLAHEFRIRECITVV